MGEMKPTPGPWFTHREGFSTIYIQASIGGGWVQEIAACGPTNDGSAQQEANARLIAEAGTVFHNTGLSPVQLVEMVENLKELAADFMDAQADLDNREYMGIHAKPYEVLIRRRNLARDDLDAALAKCEGVK